MTDAELRRFTELIDDAPRRHSGEAEARRRAYFSALLEQQQAGLAPMLRERGWTEDMIVREFARARRELENRKPAPPAGPELTRLDDRFTIG